VRRSTLVLSTAGLAAVLGVGAWQGSRLLADDDGHRRAAEAFAASWSAGQVDGLADVTDGLTPAEGDLAFAVLVEDGGFGGRTAAPLAAELLRALR
jgi:hypothetical protein